MSPQVHIGENERRGASSGFSLIEMVVAVAIMGLALSVLYQSLSGATRNTRIASEYAAATALAESTIDEFTRSLEAGDAVEGQSGIYRWSAVASAATTQPQSESVEVPGESRLKLITVSVFWDGAKGSREVRLQTIERARRSGNVS
jgi:general secretion pathway protein I